MSLELKKQLLQLLVVGNDIRTRYTIDYTWIYMDDWISNAVFAWRFSSLFSALFFRANSISVFYSFH